ncbi:MAG TPA: hypothetical protein VJ812_01985 [Gemmatimonadaceae bacterium]|nr:hypothetical protein [Gemmatimonadaceae bacterium]
MGPEIVVPIAFFTSVVSIIIGLPIARAWARKQDRLPTVPAELTARLERMEQAIDSIAIEVERISEGQRFTTKLLAERSSAREEGRLPGVPAAPPER